MITPELIAEIRAALDAATPEPWYRHERDLNYIYCGQKIVGLTQSDRTSSTLNDAILICLLRNHTPALLDEIERLRARVAELGKIIIECERELDIHCVCPYCSRDYMGDNHHPGCALAAVVKDCLTTDKENL